MAKSKNQKMRSLLKRGFARAAGRMGLSGRRTASPVDAGPPVVTFRDGDGGLIQRVSGEPGQTVLAMSRAAQVEVDHFCGGQCSCGTCRIFVLSGASNLTPMEAKEALVLGAANVNKGCRLACQAVVCGEVEVQIPRWF